MSGARSPKAGAAQRRDAKTGAAPARKPAAGRRPPHPWAPNARPGRKGHGLPRRLRRERRTVEVMVRLYCRSQHSTRHRAASGLCPDCASLLEYSDRRVERCRFGADKPVCNRCEVHCFQPDRREEIRAVMRFSGPRMAYRHPYLAVRHLIDRRRTGARERLGA